MLRSSMLKVIDVASASAGCTTLSLWRPQHKEASWAKVVGLLVLNTLAHYCVTSGLLVVEHTGDAVEVNEFDLLDMVRRESS